MIFSHHRYHPSNDACYYHFFNHNYLHYFFKSTFFVELGVGEESISMLKEMYEANKIVLIEHLEVTGISSPQLVAVDWRLDYAIRLHLNLPCDPNPAL